MADPDTTVFLSYRRDVSGPTGVPVRNDLVTHGFDVFMDVGSLDGGEFEPVILREIEARTHFLVLLEPALAGPDRRAGRLAATRDRARADATGATSCRCWPTGSACPRRGPPRRPRAACRP